MLFSVASCFLCVASLASPSAISASGGAQISPPLSFEVATVKPLDAKNPHPPSVDDLRRPVFGDRHELKELIKIAYDLNYGADQQVSGGPAWTGSTRFDIEAKEDPALGEKLQKLSSDERGKQLREMLRGLLADRFKLQIHHDSTELSVYELVMAKNGSKLMPSVPQSSPTNAGRHPRNREAGSGSRARACWKATTRTRQRW